MLFIISPAKTFANNTPSLAANVTTSKPQFEQETKELISILQQKTIGELSKELGLSQKLAELNYQRFSDFYSSTKAAPAIYNYQGDVYTQIEVEQYGIKELDYAQKHMCIISGLYGLLRPLDVIKPYRLEMITKLATSQGKNLYDFWGNKITKFINQHYKPTEIVNLASKAYFAAVQPTELKAQVINIDFKNKKDGKLTTIGLFAKKARGAMANFAIKNQLSSTQELKHFTELGYKFSLENSDKQNWVFIA